MSFDVSRSRLLVQYQVDSFTAKEFRGNPAGVVMGIRSASWMQEMSMENNLGVTAFIEPVLSDGEPRNTAVYDIRWCSPSLSLSLSLPLSLCLSLSLSLPLCLSLSLCLTLSLSLSVSLSLSLSLSLSSSKGSHQHLN
jgi:hypothetical protein